MGEEKSKILIIGGTGFIGKFIVHASARSGHPTFVLVRETTASDINKAKLLHDFTSSGVTLLHVRHLHGRSLVPGGSVRSRETGEGDRAGGRGDSTVGSGQLADQSKIIAAIKEAGNVKRFFPSEFGNDVDRVHAEEPAKSLLGVKVQVRRAIEAAGIPYTYVSSNCFAGYFLPSLAHAIDRVTILGDGNTKAIFALEEDIGTYTIKAVDDQRTLNKILYIRPPKNILSHNELVSLWEKKMGKTLDRIYVPEEEVLNQIKEASFPLDIILAIRHSIFVKGDQTNFEVEPSFGVEASELYPDVKYTTVDEYLNRFL